MADGQVVFEITADGKSAIESVKEVTNAIATEAQKWDRSADQATDKIGDSFSDMQRDIKQEAKHTADDVGNSFADIAKKAAAAFSAAKIGQAVINFGKQAVAAASDLAEVQNVVDVTFGDGAAQIETWAKAAGRQFGLTETQAKRFSSTMGAMMKSAGMAGDEIITMSTDLAGLAADMASFYNLDFETAFQKIRSGISGETEPLKQLGINMSVANLEAFALEKGITKAFNAMSQQEQTILRYQYLMQATADAQGDFARTSDGFANATRRMETALENVKTAAGNFLMTAVEPLTGQIATMLESLTQAPKETLFDRLKKIDIDKDAKIAEITAIATEAQNLIDELKLISGTDADQVIEKLATGANKLNSKAPETWKAVFGALQGIDGLQNIFSTSGDSNNLDGLVAALTSDGINSEKAEAWKSIIGTLSDNAEALTALTGKDLEGTKEWLSGIADAVNTIDPSDVDAWDKLLGTLVQGFGTDTPEGKQFIEGLAQEFLAMGTDSEAAVKGLEALGFTTEQISGKQEEWLKRCRELTSTIPGLSDVINEETGAINGGIGALDKYVEEWRASQEKLIKWKAYYAQEEAVLAQKNGLYSMQINAGGADIAMRNFMAQHPELAPYAGNSQSIQANADQKTGQEYLALYKRQQEAHEEYNTAVEQTAQATQDLANKRQYLIETTGELTEAEFEAGEAGTQAGADISESFESTAPALETALKNLEDYINGVKTSTAQAVSSVVKGFTSITIPIEEARTKISELKDQLDAGTIKQEEYDKKVQALQETLNNFSVQGMTDGLQSQLTFMEDYINNLQYLQDKGLSADFLAQFADGSVDSASRLASIVDTLKTGGEEGAAAVAELDAKYQEMAAKKDEFINALTEQKLAADQQYEAMKQAVTDAYSAMTQAASEGAAGLNVSGEVEASMSANISAMASAISSHTSEVQTAVDGIIAQLNRLNDFGVQINLGKGGINFELSLNGSHATGLDWVPFDGYLAELHEGESVLTAEENRIWQRFKQGGASSRNVDYDTMGAVMSDNVHPGGDVYLDGRVVGAVIAKQQANSYRALQRSGWQG